MQTDEVEQLIAHLYTFDARAARTRLVEIGAPAVEPLIAVLDRTHDLPDLERLKAAGVPEELLELAPALDPAAARERAAYLLGDIGDARAVEPLIAAFARERERHICLAIVRALGKIGDPRAVDTLIAALETPAWTPEYSTIVNDLDRIGGDRAVEPLIRHLHSVAYSYGSAARAAWALSHRQDDPRVLDALITGLRLDAEFSTLEAVFAGLERCGEPRGARALLNFVNGMLKLPKERWDQREENLSETDKGVVYHVLIAELRNAVAVIRHIGDPETVSALGHALATAPSYIPKV